MKKKNVASLEEMIVLAEELGVKIFICEMSMDLMGFKREEMIDYPDLKYAGVATFLADVTEAVTASLAVVVGIGFIVFGLVGIAATLVRRQVDAPLPLASLVVNAVLALAGLLLLFAGAAGSDAVDGLFNLLGVLLLQFRHDKQAADAHARQVQAQRRESF